MQEEESPSSSGFFGQFFNQRRRSADEEEERQSLLRPRRNSISASTVTQPGPSGERADPTLAYGSLENVSAARNDPPDLNMANMVVRKNKG